MRYDIKTGVEKPNSLFSLKAVVILLLLVIVALVYLVMTGEIETILSQFISE